MADLTHPPDRRNEADGGTSTDLAVRHGSMALAAVGVIGAGIAWLVDHSTARAATAQVWSPFVLVAGLLLVGLVADGDGLFAAIGARLASLAPNGIALFAGASLIVVAVTALLNLDTSVVFVTPVLVYAARSRGHSEVPLLMACLLLSNAASLLLPGSNLTNLIVLGHLNLSGGQFLAHMALPWVAATVLTAAVIAVVERHRFRPPMAQTDHEVHQARRRPLVSLGALAIVAVAVLVLSLRTPALPVVAVGAVAIIVRLLGRRVDPRRILGVLGLPVLVGLFGIAVTFGTIGRSWSGPEVLLSHLDGVGTATVAALATVLINNLPAASLLAARVPPHPYALLVGLDIGPNLFVTGSLAWVLWWRTSRDVGASPPLARTVVLGLVTVPLSMAAALALLAATGSL
jgi:arsenical pump membrane protein